MQSLAPGQRNGSTRHQEMRHGSLVGYLGFRGLAWGRAGGATAGTREPRPQQEQSPELEQSSSSDDAREQ